MTVENAQDLEGIRRVGVVVAEILSAMAAAVTPGITTRELDDIGADVVPWRCRAMRRVASQAPGQAQDALSPVALLGCAVSLPSYAAPAGYGSQLVRM